MLLQTLKSMGLDKKVGQLLSDMTPSQSGEKFGSGPDDMPRPQLDCGPYANQVPLPQLQLLPI
jgi:hypothetical protein